MPLGASASGSPAVPIVTNYQHFSINVPASAQEKPMRARETAAYLQGIIAGLGLDLGPDSLRPTVPIGSIAQDAGDIAALHLGENARDLAEFLRHVRHLDANAGNLGIEVGE